MLTITETQKKYENVCIPEDYKYLMGMRDMQMRGGGVDGCDKEQGTYNGKAGHW